jgi:Ca-activated chloride channel family protein
MRRPLLAAAAVLMLAGTGPLQAGRAAPQYSYRTGIDVVAFTVTVVDRQGQPVTGLQAEDFRIAEDGAVQSISYFGAGAGEQAPPLHLGLLFDTSRSMQRDLAFSQGAAIRFLKTFPKALDFTLVEFNTGVRASRFSQRDFPRLVERIRGLPAKGFTSLFDALSVYLGGAFTQTGRKVVVLYTDGGDTTSSLTWSDAHRLLRASDVTMYTIGFLTQNGSRRLLDQSRMTEMARMTGGIAVFPGGMNDVEKMYERIAREIQAQYTLGYISTNAAHDGAWRKVEVDVKRPASERLQIRTRQGYFAPVR